MDTLEKVLPRTIFLTVAGSRLYGTDVAESDYDFKGVCIPTHDYYFGYLKSFEQLERQVNKGHPHDLTITAFAKFVRLATACNPNVVELLYAPDDSIVHIDEWGRELLAVRDRFVTREAYRTFSGYGRAQLRKLRAEYESTGEYKTKHAMHLIRLMRMCREIMGGHGVNVRRTADRADLLDIRAGKWHYAHILAHADELDAECRALYEAGILPAEPDRVWLDWFVVDLTERYLKLDELGRVSSYWDMTRSGRTRSDRPNLSNLHGGR